MNPYVIAVAAALAFGAGWTSNGWRLGERMAENDRATTLAQSKAQAAMIEVERLAAENTAAADGVAQQEISADEKRLAELERCIAAGAGCGLRIKVRTVPAAACMPTGDAAGVGTGGGQTAELAAELGPDYRALRTGIVRLEQALAVCISATQ